jgi:hypothetical protein
MSNIIIATYIYKCVNSRADKWIMPPSRPISPTEQLNMLSWLNTEESRQLPEPKKEEVEVGYINFI